MRGFIIFVVAIIWMGLITVIFTGCKVAPDRIEKEHDACYDARYCIYLCGEDGDKSIGQYYVKECSNLRTCTNCKEIDASNFQNCWDKIQ